LSKFVILSLSVVFLFFFNGGSTSFKEILPPFHDVRFSSIVHIHINVNEFRYIYIYIYIFIIIYMNMSNAKKFYILKRRKYNTFVVPKTAEARGPVLVPPTAQMHAFSLIRKFHPF
jgi:hypothetical protein